MPIYAYKCGTCGHTEGRASKKLSDAAAHRVARNAARSTFTKQVTAAGFQLKGSGWYATDFRDSGKGAGKSAPASEPAAEGAACATAESGKDGASAGAACAGCTAPAAAAPQA